MSVELTPGRSRYVENGDDRFIEPIQSEQEDREVSLPSYEILTYPADFTLEVLVDKWNKGEIRVPRFQRRFVWTQAQSSKLIESFLLGLPVPPVFFYQDRDDSCLLVVDGQQRLRSIVYFFSGLFGDSTSGKKTSSFNLIGLDEHSSFREVTYQQLKSSNQSAFNRLQNSVLRSFVMKQLDPADDTSIFQVFERLNTGVVVLQGQEIRNCIFDGPFNNLLMEINKHAAWRQVVGNRNADKRMRDIELILRFLALFGNLKHYEKPMKKFLNDFMKANRSLQGKRLEQFRNLFEQTTDAVVKYLGARPFHIHRGLNAAVYDSVFVAFARNLGNVDAANVTEAAIKRIRSRFDKLVTDESYLVWVSSHTTDVDVVPKRIDKAVSVMFG